MQEKQPVAKSKFEDFITTQEGEDLFGKIRRVNQILSSNVLTGNEGLGMQSLGCTSPICKIKEKDNRIHNVIMLGSNSYLNMGTDKRVINAAKKALLKYGNGMGAVSNYTGLSDLHRELELKIAKFYQTEDAIVFPSGYGTNIGVISALCGKGDVIINDSANHASIFDGCALSGAEIRIYPHGNIDYLKKILSRLDSSRTGRLIITDGVFSMSGDTAELDEIVALAKFYDAKALLENREDVPHCTCGGIIKPDVVLYEEGLDQKTIQDSIYHITNADALIIGGTSLSVYPAASLIDYFRGKYLVVINKSPTPRDEQADLLIAESIGKVLGALEIKEV